MPIRNFLARVIPIVGVTAVTLAACSSSSSSAGAVKDGGGSDDSAAIDDGGTGDEGRPTTLPDGAPIPREHLRIMTGNLTSGNNQNYDDGAGARIFTGLHPDVILIQEFNVGDKSAAAAQTFVETVCGPGCSFFQQPPANYSIPNGVITRFPIVASGTWDDPLTTDRDFAWAQIDVPGPVDLYAVSVHLLTSKASERSAQAGSLVDFVNANVPAGSYVVIGGDFNTDSRDEQAPVTLAAVVDTSGPYPSDNGKNENTNAPRNKPYDWVAASPNLMASTVPVKIGAQSFDPGLVVDTRVYTPIEDLAPALASDSAASNMQHMGVVRDFMIPSE